MVRLSYELVVRDEGEKKKLELTSLIWGMVWSRLNIIRRCYSLKLSNRYHSFCQSLKISMIKSLLTHLPDTWLELLGGRCVVY